MGIYMMYSTQWPRTLSHADQACFSGRPDPVTHVWTGLVLTAQVNVASAARPGPLALPRHPTAQPLDLLPRHLPPGPRRRRRHATTAATAASLPVPVSIAVLLLLFVRVVARVRAVLINVGLGLRSESGYKCGALRVVPAIVTVIVTAVVFSSILVVVVVHEVSAAGRVNGGGVSRMVAGTVRLLAGRPATPEGTQHAGGSAAVLTAATAATDCPCAGCCCHATSTHNASAAIAAAIATAPGQLSTPPCPRGRGARCLGLPPTACGAVAARPLQEKRLAGCRLAAPPAATAAAATASHAGRPVRSTRGLLRLHLWRTCLPLPRLLLRQ